MHKNLIDNDTFYSACIAGAKEVIKHKDHLNKINVFPVADGDTGTNLSTMMRSLIEQSRCAKDSFHGTVRSLADASLSGARGNSGVIFSQFFNGLSLALDKIKPGNVKENALTVDEFCQLATSASLYAEKAIDKPTEGTIITVMRDWAHACGRFCKDKLHFSDLLTSSLKEAKKSLDHTTEKLKALKDNHVVDSGAQGFVYFLEGLIQFLKTGKQSDVVIEDTLDIDHSNEEHIISSEEPHNRYCTEALIKGDDLNIESLRNTLRQFGDSFVIAGHKERARIHIHTNTPEEVFAHLPESAQIQQKKVEDMQRQHQAVNSRKSDIALVVDSIADISPDLMKEHQIHLAPLNLIIDHNTYLDRLTITPDKLINRLKDIEVYPTSSQPNYKVVESLFSFLKQHYKSIIVVSVGKKLSGTYNLFQQVANRFEDFPISIVDTRSNSGAEGLIAKKVAEFIQAGMPHDDIIERIENYIPKTDIFISVLDFKHLIRSGRISPLKGVIANFFNMKPIVSMDNIKGKAYVVGKAFSDKANQSKLVSIVTKKHQKTPIREYCITHVNCIDKAKEMADKLTESLGFGPSYISQVSPVTTLHAGEGCVSVSTMVE